MLLHRHAGHWCYVFSCYVAGLIFGSLDTDVALCSVATHLSPCMCASAYVVHCYYSSAILTHRLGVGVLDVTPQAPSRICYTIQKLKNTCQHPDHGWPACCFGLHSIECLRTILMSFRNRPERRQPQHQSVRSPPRFRRSGARETQSPLAASQRGHRQSCA